MNSGNDGRSIRDAVEARIERLHRNDHGGEHLANFLDAPSGVERVSSFESGIGDIQSSFEVNGDLAHGSPSIGAVDVPPSAVSDPIVGEAPGAPVPQAVAVPGVTFGEVSS